MARILLKFDRLLLMLLWLSHGRCPSIPEYCDIPGPVRNLTVRGEDNAQFLMEWRAPGNVNASCVESYQVCLTMQDNEIVVCYDAWTTSIEVTDVFQTRPCSSFSALVSTVAAGGEITAITNATLYTAPRAVDGMEAEHTTANSTTLNWSLIPVGTSCIDHYVLTTCVSEYELSNATCTERNRKVGSFIYESEKMQLVPCSYNRLTVAAVNTQGSRLSTFITVKTGNSDPPVVSGLMVKVNNSCTFTLKWTRPKSMDPHCTAGYKVCYELTGHTTRMCAVTDTESWSNVHANSTRAHSHYTAYVSTVDAVLSLDSKTSKEVSANFSTGSNLCS